jgi:hypothetical protein
MVIRETYVSLHNQNSKIQKSKNQKSKIQKSKKKICTFVSNGTP